MKLTTAVKIWDALKGKELSFATLADAIIAGGETLENDIPCVSPPALAVDTDWPKWWHMSAFGLACAESEEDWGKFYDATGQDPRVEKYGDRMAAHARKCGWTRATPEYAKDFLNPPPKSPAPPDWPKFLKSGSGHVFKFTKAGKEGRYETCNLGLMFTHDKAVAIGYEGAKPITSEEAERLLNPPKAPAESSVEKFTREFPTRLTEAANSIAKILDDKPAFRPRQRNC